jgi:riboflavin synthase
MFTGLVEALGRVEASGRAGAGHRLALRVPEDWAREVRAGDSIAVSGVCLTAVVVGRPWGGTWSWATWTASGASPRSRPRARGGG